MAIEITSNAANFLSTTFGVVDLRIGLYGYNITVTQLADILYGAGQAYRRRPREYIPVPGRGVDGGRLQYDDFNREIGRNITDNPLRRW